MYKKPIKRTAKFIIWFLFLLGYGSFLSAPSAASSSDEIRYQIHFCQTSTPINEIEEAIQCDYDSPYHPLALGFGEHPRWVRIQIESSNQNSIFAIQVRPYFLRDIHFYSQSADGWTINKAGSQITNDQSHSDIGGYFFITKPSQSNLNTYYLQVQASSIARISVAVIPWPNSTLQPSGHLMGIGAQIGILATILIFSLVSLLLSPSLVMSVFNLYIANLIFCILSGSGILALYVFKQMPVFNEILFFTGLCLKLGLWVWLAQCFLREYKTPSWYKASCWAIYGLVALSILLGIVGKIDIAILIILIGYTVTSITQILGTIKTPSAGKLLQNALIAGFGISITLIYLAVASAFFPLDTNSSVPLYLSRMTDFVNPLIMLSIIVLQNRLTRRELSQVKIALTETKMKSELEGRLLKERQTLIDMLSHELKNPLATIGLAADTLSRSHNTRNESDQRRLQNINQAILNMDNIIERCSLMNRIDQRSIPLNLSEINLNIYVSDLIRSLNFQQRINLNIDKTIMLRTDPEFLKIIMTNLVENGVKYSPSETQMKIWSEVSKKDGSESLKILISNPIEQGLEPDLDSLFERFYRHPLAKETRGSGLGLSICKELCNVLDGTIEYQLINHEATFIVELPR
jgi:signal transduction histidine kinase